MNGFKPQVMLAQVASPSYNSGVWFDESMRMRPMTQMTFELAEESLAPEDLRHNKLKDTDRAFHDWYRFVLSYPPHLVRTYFSRFGLGTGHLVLDPFCGTGTTLVEAKKNGIQSYGIEANPMACFASEVKTSWCIDPEELVKHAKMVCRRAWRALNDWNGPLKTLPPEQEQLLLAHSIDPVPLHKCLLLRNEILRTSDLVVREVGLLGLAFVSVFVASNLKFGPEVGVGAKRKMDAPVFESWLSKVIEMASDVRQFASLASVISRCTLGDARQIPSDLAPGSVDAVITSPPYPNEKDYTRTTRLESVLLGFLHDKQELRAFKQSHLRTSVEGIGQVETDELYVGVNKTGEQFIFPLQAKGARDKVGIVQLEQDLALCESKFPALTCHPLAAQFVQDDLIALFEFERSEGAISIKEEKHYRLVPNEDLSDDEIAHYRS